jgi:tRNA(fMet)-specific endonuclease VapC
VTERYLLDTNILSDMIRNPDGSSARRYRELDDEQLCTSIIVAAELRYGAAKKNSASLTARIAEMLAGLEVVALDTPTDAAYARLRVELERIGNPVGPHDLLIAAQALSLDMVIVTANEREFSRVPGLKVENWMRPLPN